MRFAPRRSERSVAVATARFSLASVKAGVRLDTSLGFLMKVVSCFLQRLHFSFSVFLGASNCPMGFSLVQEECCLLWLGLNCIS